MGKLISLDIGDARIGIASTDETRLIVSPLDVFIRTASIKADIRKLALLINNLILDSIIIGIPLDALGNTGIQAEKVLEFSRRLENQVNCDIIFWDERFSTQEAAEELIEMRASRKKRKKVIDQCAAVIILESYLNSKIGDK